MRRRVQQLGIAYKFVRQPTDQWEEALLPPSSASLLLHIRIGYVFLAFSLPAILGALLCPSLRREAPGGKALNRDAAPSVMPQVELSSAVPLVLEQAEGRYDSRLMA
ncbi:unnamed protein product [Prorocentrum cordatum]|uniref:Uncharacterized protein n=1 Tax=Prorocentrum cordatum TaxID=2364126 RepID=A0ABN9RUF2_9DINO|nr:unnamed protein product [Polarella glacialis]